MTRIRNEKRIPKREFTRIKNAIAISVKKKFVELNEQYAKQREKQEDKKKTKNIPGSSKSIK